MNFRSVCLSRKRGKAEIIVFLVYAVCLAVISAFHEPWFDEAQAWQIARCASIKEILFDIPHYEGHPQLWHLILVPFAKLGAPYEFTMHAVNYVFSVGAVALLLFKSPIPKAIRCILPFNYFIFYQFGVLSRPYSMLMFVMMLTAVIYPKRNQMPVRYILVLCWLCLCSAYGIVAAGGLCMLWTWEIFQEYRSAHKWNKLGKDVRFWLLWVILVFAILLILCILPAEDCYFAGSNMTVKEHLLDALDSLNLIILFPFDAFIGCILGESGAFFTSSGIIAEYIGGVILWAIILPFLHTNKKLSLFLIPYGLLMFFALAVYYSIHHIGMTTLFMIFVFWQICADPEGIRIPPLFRQIRSKIDSVWTIRLGYVLLAFIAIASPASAAVSSVTDILHSYGMKEVADFIKENQLEDRKIMTIWTANISSKDVTGKKLQEKAQDVLESIIWDETLPADIPPLENTYPYLNGVTTAIQPYFDKNIFMNFNADDPDCLYMKWIDCGDNYREVYEQWRAQGLPDIIIGLVPLDEIYSEEELEGVTYYWIATCESGKIWKFYREEGEWKIYIRSDLLDEYPQFEIQKYATILNPDFVE